MKLKYLFLVSYSILILILSSIPLEFPEVIERFDPTKFTLHLLEYTIFGYLVKWCFSLRNSFLFAFSFAFFDEFHQIFIPYRKFDPSDLLANFLGLIIGIFLFIKIRKE